MKISEAADLGVELLVFPNGLHDDQVDTVAYGGRVMVKYKSTRFPISYRSKESPEADLDKERPSGLDVSAVSSSHRSGLDAYLHRKKKEYGL